MSVVSSYLGPVIAAALAFSTSAGEAQQRLQSDGPGMELNRGTTIEISATAVSDVDTGSELPARLVDRPTGLPMRKVAALLKAQYGVDLPSTGLRRWDSISILASASDADANVVDGEDAPVLVFSTTEHLRFRQDGLEWNISIRRTRSTEDDQGNEDLIVTHRMTTAIRESAARESAAPPSLRRAGPQQGGWPRTRRP